MQDWMYILGPLALAFVLVTAIDWRRNRQREKDRLRERPAHRRDTSQPWQHTAADGWDEGGGRCGSDRSTRKDSFWDTLFDGDGGGDGGGGGD